MDVSPNYQPRLLAAGWGPQKAYERRVRYATSLMREGIEFRSAVGAEVPRAEQIVRDQIDVSPHWRRDPDDGVIIVSHPIHGVIATCIMGVIASASVTIACLKHVAVVPAWQRQGIGTVLVGVIDQPISEQLGHGPDFVYGGCAPSSARFYQRAGFTVLQEGEMLSLPGSEVILANPSTKYPSWFFSER